MNAEAWDTNALKQLSTPSTLVTPVTSARSRRLLHLSSPSAPGTRARDPMRSYLPLISSPLAPSNSQRDRESLRLSSPRESVTGTPSPSHLNLSTILVASTRSLNSSQSAPAPSTQVEQAEDLSPSSPSADTQGSAVLLSSRISPTTDVRSPFKELSTTSPIAAGSTRCIAAIQQTPPSMQSRVLADPTTSEQAPLAVQQLTLDQSSPQGSGSMVDMADVGLCELFEA